MSFQLDFLHALAQPSSPPVDPVDAAPLERHARDLVRRAGSATLAARVKVRWNPRMRSTAGMASAAKSLITLNPRLIEFGWEEIDRTLRHELAHLLAQERAGRRRIAPHGREWQRACVALGLQNEKRCHDLPLPRRQLAPRHRYRCPHCTVVIGRVRPLRRKSACLACCRRHNRGRYDERFRFEKLAA
jgi:predicted SprT family Zn-dependent metalloprotease